MSDSTLEITDSTAFALDLFTSNTLFSNPESILCLSISDPLISPSSDVLPVAQDSEHSNLVGPLSGEQLRQVLQRLPHLEEIRWLSSLPPPSELSELLSRYCPRLIKFVCEPQYLPLATQRSALPKWDAPSISLLHSLCITSLRVSRLSQAGAQELGVLFQSLGEDCSLEELVIDLLWLDDHLCHSIVEGGRRLKSLSLGTSGTKFTDSGLVSLLEGCESLEHFSLSEVQGRLSKKVWTKPCSVSIRSLEIVLSEIGPHHSWTVDHLSSIHVFPLDQLTSLVIRRKPGLPSNLADDPALVVHSSSVDEIMALKPVPEEFIGSLGSCSELVNLECDFWSFTLSDLKTISTSCPKLESVRLCLDERFSKLLSSSVNASFSNLRSLRVSIVPAHAPGSPPAPQLPRGVETSLPTPGSSPMLPSKCITELPPPGEKLSHSDSGDPSAPLLREVKRFVRKFPKLEILEWYGSYGRGLWTVSRPTTPTKTSLSISVDFHPPTVDIDMYNTMLCEQRLKLLKDRGICLKEYSREGTKAATSPSPTPSDKRSSARSRKVSLPPPVQEVEAPEKKDQEPLTPPISERSICESPPTHHATDEKLIESPKSDTFRRRERMPSEPTMPSAPPPKTRRRNSTNTGQKMVDNAAGTGNGMKGNRNRGKSATVNRTSQRETGSGGYQAFRGGRRASGDAGKGMTGRQ